MCLHALFHSCSMGAPPLVETDGETDTYQISLKELKKYVLPIIIRRYLPSLPGEPRIYEDWPLDNGSNDGLKIDHK